jgi:hypothetical protein
MLGIFKVNETKCGRGEKVTAAINMEVVVGTGYRQLDGPIDRYKAAMADLGVKLVRDYEIDLSRPNARLHIFVLEPKSEIERQIIRSQAKSIFRESFMEMYT